MKSKFLQVRKMLLVAAGLLVGASAWAGVGDVTTNADIDFSNEIADGVIAGATNSMTIEVNATYPTEKGSEGNGNLILGKGTNTVTIPEAQYAGSRDKVTISFDLAFGKLTGKEVFFNAVDKDGGEIFKVSHNAYSGEFSVNTLDIASSDWYRDYNTVIWARKATLTIVIDYAAKTITTTVLNNYTNKTNSHIVNLSNANPVATFSVGSNYENNDRRCQFDNLKITTTEGDYTVSTAQYTIKYVCDGTSVKADDVREGDVDTAISLLASDKATFDADGQRYIYVSDDLGEKTILGSGEQVVTITFRKAAKYGYTITSSYNGKTLPFSQDTQYVWEDENSVIVQCPKYIVTGTTLVVAPLGSNGEPRQAFTITEDGFVGNIEYTSTVITNIYFYSEAEDLAETGLSIGSNTGANDRVSGGKLAYASSSEDTYTLLTLPAGKYIFTLGAWGGANNEWTYSIMAGEQELINSSCAQNTLKLTSSEEFTLTETTAITYKANNNSGSRGIDLIYIQKTGEIGTIATSGYSTLASAYGLDFANAEGLTAAYIVTEITSDAVKLEEVDELPANNGVILMGEGGASYSIPVKADAAFDGTNLLKAAVTATAVEANEAYILQNGEFHLVTAASEVPAGKAYLLKENVPAEARTLSLLFGGETTGIAEVEKAGAENGAIYNLSGQRVSKPASGLYIMNGKKVIIK